jgi:hypothetical protein
MLPSMLERRGAGRRSTGGLGHAAEQAHRFGARWLTDGRGRPAGGGLAPEPVDRGSTPEEIVAALDLAARVRRAVDDLPRGQRAFAAGLLTAAGGRAREVRISQLTEGVIYAEVVVDRPGGPRTMDARPSDALNLAVLTGAPIRASVAVVDACDAAKAANSPEPWPDPYREGTAGAAELAAEIEAGGGWPGSRASVAPGRGR